MRNHFNHPPYRHTVLTSALLLALSAPVPAEYPSSFPISDGQAVEGQFIVKLKAGLESDSVTSLQQELQATTVEEFPLIGAELWQVDTGSISSEAVRQQALNDPRVEYIEPNYLVSSLATSDDPGILTTSEEPSPLATPNDPDFSKLWGLHNTGQTGGKADADIDAPEAWNVTTGGNGDVVIAVIDTGVDYTHPDLAANMWKNTKEVAGNGKDDDGNGYVDDVYGYDFANKDGDPMDDNLHGTHCAGTIAGVGNNSTGVVGVNWKAKIMAVKFLSGSGGGSLADAISAIQYAVKMGAKISSNSWGCVNCPSQALYDAIKAANAQGQLFIAAAGNHGDGNQKGNNDGSYISYPSSYDLENIVAVAATDHLDGLASFSGFGLKSVDLGAPGVDIYSTAPGKTYKSLNGTSMATPHVSGVAALLKAHKPSLTHLDIKKRILDTVDKIPALNGKSVTGGRLNAYNAVNYDGPPPPTGIKARFQAVVQGFCVDLDGSTSTPSTGAKIVNYIWTIVKSATLGGEGTPSPELGICVPEAGTYSFGLTVKDDKGSSNSTSLNITFRLPKLGDKAVAIRANRPLYTAARIEGGIKVSKEGEVPDAVDTDTPDLPLLESLYNDQVTQSLSDPVDVRGEIQVESAHIGQTADIVVFADLPIDESTTLSFMLDSNGIPQLWDNQPETLVAFKPQIPLSAIQTVEMYKGKFVLPGTLKVYFGYRLQDGTVIQNSKPIDIEILP